MTHDTSPLYSQAQSVLTSIFTRLLIDDPDIRFEEFEDRSIRAVHELTASAMGEALERYDKLICSELPERYRVHDRRSRTMATEVGDITFFWRRVKGPHGYFIPLADTLDVPWGCRVSPGASEFLLQAGAEVSYLRAARLLERKGGSSVSASTVMTIMRHYGDLCRQDDEGRASSLYDLGVVPDGQTQAEEICVEADGTWIPLQNQPAGAPKRVEIKALVAYSGKVEKGRKVKREQVIHHGCVGTPSEFWPQSIAAVGTKFDLSKVRSVHLGTDGESWCKRGPAWFPMRMDVTGHLDPFHINRAVLSCFADPLDGWKILEVLLDGDKEEAITLLEICRDTKIAREKNANRVIGYLRNNMSLIGIEGPSLGTMESENQHLYSARMESVPCAWSRQGVSDMARIRSRIHSKRSIPRRSRTNSVTPRRRRLQESGEIKYYSQIPGCAQVVKSVGSGYLPKQASLVNLAADVRHAANVNGGMAKLRG